MTRHKRRAALTAAEISEITGQAEILHTRLCMHMRLLKPQDDAYRHLLALDQAIENMVRDLTGEDPPWCRIRPGFMAGT